MASTAIGQSLGLRGVTEVALTAALMVCLLSTAPPQDVKAYQVEGIQVSRYRSDHRAEYKTQLIYWDKGKIVGYSCVWPDQGQWYSLRGSRSAPLVLVYRPHMK